MNKSRFMHFIHVAVLAFGLCAISTQSFAAVVCAGDNATHVATSCSGIVYNGTTYDLSWALPDYPASPTPIIDPAVTPRTDAGLLTQAINSALNDAGFTNIEYTTPTGTNTVGVCTDYTSQPCFYVPYAIYANTVGTWESKYTGPTNGWYTDPAVNLATGGGPSLYYWNFSAQNSRPVTVFTPAVPTPAALPLFLSGMVLAGWMGRRQRQDG